MRPLVRALRWFSPAGMPYGIYMRHVKDRIGRVIGRVRARCVLRHLDVLRSVMKNRPTPLAYWRLIRLALALPPVSVDPLALNNRGLARLRLTNRDLIKLFEDEPTNSFCCDALGLETLWERAAEEKPQVILECGSGLTTLLFAEYARRVQHDSSVRCLIVSLEQYESALSDTRARLQRHGLEDYAQILHVPVSEEGEYQLDPPVLEHIMEGRLADWLVVDGPFGPPGCRLATLPLLASFMRSGARWFLDDAFRDGELQVLNHWVKQVGVTVAGISCTGHGLASGTIHHVGPAVAAGPIRN